MPDITAIAQALGAFKALKDIGEATIGLANAAAFRERQIEFQGKIIDAQGALMALQEERSTLLERISQLEEEMARLEAWEAEKQRYELQDISSGQGSSAYVVKPSMQGTEPLHCICANCYEDGKKSILQRTSVIAPEANSLYCPRCTARVLLWGWPRQTSR
jgi:hypothetical protein